MPDTPSGGAKAPAGQGAQNTLTRKIGPLPIWAWGAITVGVYYWWTHYGPGAKSQQAQQQGGQQGTGGGLRSVVVNIRDSVTRTVTGQPGPAGPPGPPGPPGPTPPPPKPPPKDDDDRRRRRDRDRMHRPREPLSPPSSPFVPVGTPHEPLTPPSSPFEPVGPPSAGPPGRDRDRDKVAVSSSGQRITVTAPQRAGQQPPQPPQPVFAESSLTGSPLFAEWIADEQGSVPEPVEAFAPMTAGAIHNG